MDIASLRELEPLFGDSRSLWVILDIDDTLIRSPQHWGSDRWYYERIAVHRAAGLAEEAAILAGNDDWERAQLSLEPVAVEADAAPRVRSWQERGIPLLGLTARRPEIAPLTRRHLAGVGFDLARTAPPLASPLFIDGILYVGPLASKGAEIAKLLARRRPARIIFTDDRDEHLASIAIHLRQLGIAGEGRRFRIPPAQ